VKHGIFIYVFCIACVFIQAQVASDVQKLEKEIAESKSDTNKVNYLVKLSMLVTNNDFKRATSAANEALDLSIKLKYPKGTANAYNGLADAYWYHSDFEKAQLNYFKSYRIHDSIHNEQGVALALYNIGWIMAVQKKNYDQMGYLYKSLTSFEKIKDTSGLIRISNALGTCYGNQYSEKGQKRELFDSSMKYFDKGIKIGKHSTYSNHVNRIYGNMADLFGEAGDFNSALFYIDKGLQGLLKANDTAMYMTSSAIKANFLLQLKKYQEAKEIFEQVVEYSSERDLKDVWAPSVHGLAVCNYFLGNYKDAYRDMEDFTNLSEILYKEAYSTNIEQLQGKYNLEKTEASLKEAQQSTEIEKLKNKQNSYFIFVLLGVAFVVIVIATLLFRQNKLKQTANTLLKEQNTIISEKKKEIEHSIQYAKGIQNALLPAIKDIKSVFPEGFIYYLPKDVVSGDFYWFHKLGDYFYLVAADCTGHGVPGALMSIVSMDKLSQAMFEKKLTEPKEILSFVNIEIKNSLKQHDDKTKQRDGLDLALVRINTRTNVIDFSAANRPLYIVSKGEMKEHKADKISIAGFTPDEHLFQQISLQLNKGDCLYLSTDGYADQFGGTESKKFMTKNFKSLLQKIHHLDMNSQESELINNHLSWKGNYEQVDDILVIGIKM
jgi:serine phosphatase RsbU (regulator of sigma subunit)